MKFSCVLACPNPLPRLRPSVTVLTCSKDSMRGETAGVVLPLYLPRLEEAIPPSILLPWSGVGNPL